jgi:2-methylcitrate dehydratase PrpD
VVKGSNDFRSCFDAMNNGFSDREVIDVARKVSVVHDEESEAIYPTTRESQFRNEKRTKIFCKSFSSKRQSGESSITAGARG